MKLLHCKVFPQFSCISWCVHVVVVNWTRREARKGDGMYIAGKVDRYAGWQFSDLKLATSNRCKDTAQVCGSKHMAAKTPVCYWLL